MNDQPPSPPTLLPDERAEFVHANGLRLLCRQWGRIDAPAIVLLHGLRGFSGTWRTLAAELSTKYRLIALDQRGRGESDWDSGRNYYTDAYLADLEAVIDWFGLGRFVLIGHSMGGDVVTEAARHLKRQVVGLIWLYLTNAALIAGVELDAEFTRVKQLASGEDAARTLNLPVRDIPAFPELDAGTRLTGFISGGGLSETLLGYSDVGLMGFELNLAAVTRLAACCAIPLLPAC